MARLTIAAVVGILGVEGHRTQEEGGTALLVGIQADGSQEAHLAYQVAQMASGVSQTLGHPREEPFLTRVQLACHDLGQVGAHSFCRRPERVEDLPRRATRRFLHGELRALGTASFPALGQLQSLLASSLA